MTMSGSLLSSSSSLSLRKPSKQAWVVFALSCVAVLTLQLTLFAAVLPRRQEEEGYASDLWALVSHQQQPSTTTQLVRWIERRSTTNPNQNQEKGHNGGGGGDDEEPVSCSTIRQHLHHLPDSGNQNSTGPTSKDPNEGVLYARQLVSDPTFMVSLHKESYDWVRWKFIMEEGKYYEHDVHRRFVHILQQHQQESAPLLVLDVGMNIGYYSLLAATLGHASIGFEINHANILRMCESLLLNQIYAPPHPEAQVAIYRRGVSQVDDQTVFVVVPSNPGQATIVHNQAQAIRRYKTGANMKRSGDTVQSVATITLDTFAEKRGWFNSDDDDTSQNPHGGPPSIAILKIDVEGIEPQVLLGAKRLIETRRIQHILTEYRANIHGSEINQQALKMLLDAGYTLVLGGRLTTRKQTEQFLPMLVNALKREPFDLWFSSCSPSSSSSPTTTNSSSTTDNRSSEFSSTCEFLQLESDPLPKVLHGHF